MRSRGFCSRNDARAINNRTGRLHKLSFLVISLVKKGIPAKWPRRDRFMKLGTCFANERLY